VLLASLLLAVQVTVQTEVRADSTRGGSVSVGVRTPRRIPVTDEHRRTAFKDAAARDLLLHARAARLEQDSTLLSYDVKSYQRISVGMSLRETARDRLVFRNENAAHVRWHRDFGARVEILGARSAVPIMAGIRDAEDELQQDMLDEVGDMMAIPYYPGKDELWLFEMIGEAPEDADSTDREDGPMLVHPVAEGSEAYFTFKTGDSVLMALPNGARVTLRELIVSPREPRWNLVVGSFWFETERAHLVRAVMRFSAPMDVWEQVEADDSTANDDVPVLVRGLMTPMKAEITAVTIEYGLLEQRFWLPRVQGAEGYGRAGMFRIPVKIEQRYRYNSVNATEPEGVIPGPRWARSDSVRDSLRASGLDSSAVRDSMRVYYAQRDTLRRAARDSSCAASGNFIEYSRRENGRLPLAVTVPCDVKKLATSAELPPSIYDAGEELFGAKERAELMEALDFGLQPAWAPRPPTISYGLSHTRYNRVEGFGSGLGASSQLGRGYTASALARVSLADLQMNGEFTLARTNGRRDLRGTVYRRLAVSSDFGDPLSFGASMGGLLYARDEGFYHRAWGLELAGERAPRGGAEWRLFAEQQWTAPVETEWSLFGGAHDDDFIANVVADKGWYYGGGLRWRASRGLDPQGWRGSADLRLEGATGELEYGRYFVETILSRGLGPVAASLTAAAGSSSGELPAQRQFFLGGTQSVRGQTAGTAVGEAFWLGRLELGTNVAAVRPLVFGDLGWAGPRDGWNAIGRPMAGVGAGVSFLDGLIRVDLARGIHPRWQTRFDLYLEARF
jgi:hypothetical protein